MSNFWIDDLSGMFQDFSDVATWNNTTINVLFDDSFVAENLQTGQIETLQPQAHCISSDVAGIKHEDQITIQNQQYKVLSIQPTGDGMTLITLQKV